MKKNKYLDVNKDIYIRIDYKTNHTHGTIYVYVDALDSIYRKLNRLVIKKADAIIRLYKENEDNTIIVGEFYTLEDVIDWRNRFYAKYD